MHTTALSIVPTWAAGIMGDAAVSGLAVEILTPMRVRYDRSLRMAIIAGSPQTDSTGRIFSLKNQWYEEDRGLETMVLVNMPQDSWMRVNDNMTCENFDTVVGWARKNNLVQTTPYELLAITERYPTLNLRLNSGTKVLCLVETTGFIISDLSVRYSCYVEWRNGNRRADYDYSHNRSYGPDWLVFKASAALL